MKTVYYIKWRSNGKIHTSNPINSHWLAKSLLEFLQAKYPDFEHWIDTVQMQPVRQPE